MDAMTVLKQRVSVPALVAPAPSAEQLAQLVAAGLRAADHANLRPWRFLAIEGAGLDRFGELLVATREASEGPLGAAERKGVISKAKRAPMILVVIAQVQEHPKVPALEQLISAGCAAQNILNAAHALGLGAMWRTGSVAYHPRMREGLGLRDGEQVVGFLYLGTPKGSLKPVPDLDPADFLQRWP